MSERHYLTAKGIACGAALEADTHATTAPFSTITPVTCIGCRRAISQDVAHRGLAMSNRKHSED